ncbi:MAG: SDR family NAD(P)-dependent oxidoreductase [Candidatus Adiutrix sp.]|jgi:uncharacterized oxidoreductase|nr:SDR family NAD(P)-dependent oxidoreductase [Candidatus Adiutrix sp.]
MKLTQNSILVTGGSSGIGLALAERLLARGNRVIICGRREAKLREAKERHPALETRVCDVSEEKERLALAAWLEEACPELNVLVNNAGIQQRMDLLATNREWDYYRREIATNLEAPLHLSLLLARRLTQRPEAAIINISSGLAFTPIAGLPVYCATKAALHSFSISLRWQLKAAGVEVVEIAPPAVRTDLGGPGRHDFGVPVDEFADAAMRDLEAGKREIGYGTSEPLARLSWDELDKAIAEINQSFILD